MQCKLTSAVSLALLAIGIGSAQANEKVTFSLNWVPYGLHYGIFAAEAQGYYREAGLDLDIQRGYGSGDTVKRTATGAADIGMADMASVIVGRGNGLATKQVATLLDRSADAIFYIKGAGISTPKDLPGRSLGATIGETTLNLLPVFAANAGFDHKKVEIVNLAPPAKFPTSCRRRSMRSSLSEPRNRAFWRPPARPASRSTASCSAISASTTTRSVSSSTTRRWPSGRRW